MEYAIIKASGRQYKVSPGEEIVVDNLLLEKDKEVFFDKVYLWVSSENVKIGKPTIGGVTVKAKVVDNIKGDKVKVAKFKSKVRYRRTIGFRPLRTILRIEKIESLVKKQSSPPKSLKKK